MARFIEKAKVDEYLRQIRQGDSSALEPLYELTSKKLYAFCYTYLRNHHDSEDALSDTYLSVVRYADKFKGKSGFAWLYTIAKNICLNMIRTRGRVEYVDLHDEETVNTLHLLDDTEQVRAEDESGIIALAKQILNENELQIVILHTVNGMKLKEIAKILEANESTTRWQYNNAIKKLKTEYERRQRQ